MECKICHESHPDLDHVLRHVHPAHGLLPAQYVTIFDCNTEQGNNNNNNKPEKLNSESQSVKMDPDLIVAEDELNFHHLLPKHPLPPEAIKTTRVNQEQPPRVEAAVRLDSKPRMEVETQNETSRKIEKSTVCKVMNAHLGH